MSSEWKLAFAEKYLNAQYFSAGKALECARRIYKVHSGESPNNSSNSREASRQSRMASHCRHVADCWVKYQAHHLGCHKRSSANLWQVQHSIWFVANVAVNRYCKCISGFLIALCLLSEMDVHKDHIQCVDWKSDGKLVATTARDKTLRVLDPRANSVVQVMFWVSLFVLFRRHFVLV